MKNVNFKLVFSKYIYVLAATALLIALSTIILNLLKLIGIDNLPPYQPVIDTISMILGLVIIGTVIYSVFFSRFSFKQDKMTFYLAIFQVSILYENMLLLRHDLKTNMMLLYYNKPSENEQEDIKYLIINIKKEEIEDFVEQIKSVNRRVIYEIFDKEKDNQ